MKNRCKRDRFEIVTDILGLVASDKKLKTQIMYQCNLSFSQTKLYINALMKAGFMAIDDSVYHITPQGKVILQGGRELRRKMEPLSFLGKRIVNLNIENIKSYYASKEALFKFCPLQQ